MLAGLQNVIFEFGARIIVEDATWHIQPGERIGLIGYNGTGKSTLLKLLVGEYSPSAGTVERSRTTTIGYLHQDLLKAKLRVVGVSPQDVASHRRFADQHGLNFPLLADPDKTVVKAYDLDGPLGFGVRRGTYLIGRDGKIQDSVLADLRIGAHEAFVLNAIKSGASK